MHFCGRVTIFWATNYPHSGIKLFKFQRTLNWQDGRGSNPQTFGVTSRRSSQLSYHPKMACEAGFEPATLTLTVSISTIELLANHKLFQRTPHAKKPSDFHLKAQLNKKAVKPKPSGSGLYSDYLVFEFSFCLFFSAIILLILYLYHKILFCQELFLTILYFFGA